MKWSTIGFVSLALGIAWKFLLLLLALFGLIALERTIEYFVHRYRKRKKGGRRG